MEVCRNLAESFCVILITVLAPRRLVCWLDYDDLICMSLHILLYDHFHSFVNFMTSQFTT